MFRILGAYPHTIYPHLQIGATICLNEKAKLKLHLIRINPQEDEWATLWFTPYTPYPSNCSPNYNALLNGNDYTVGTFNKNLSEACLFNGGTMPCEVHKVSWNINFPSNTIVEINKPRSLGVSQESFNDLSMWAAVENLTTTSATLYTNVFKATISPGVYVWIPCEPENAVVAYRLITVPPLGYPTITSNLPSYGSNSWNLHKTVTGNFYTQAVGATAYEWQYFICNPNNPPGPWPWSQTLQQYGLLSNSSQYGQFINIYNQNFQGQSCPGRCTYKGSPLFTSKSQSQL